MMDEHEIRAIVTAAVREAMQEYLQVKHYEHSYKLAEMVREAVRTGLTDVVVSRDQDARRTMERHEPLAIDVGRMGDRLNNQISENVNRLRDQIERFEGDMQLLFGRPWGGSPTVCNYNAQDISKIMKRIEDIAQKLGC